MNYIGYNTAFTAVLRIPDSAAGDTVTYTIIKASNGATFGSGAATSLGNNLWKVTFTPTTQDETYVLTVDDETLDVQTSESYMCVNTQPVAVEQTTATTSAELLTKVNSAISALLNGGAVQSYMIGGRNVMYMSLDQLQRLRETLQKEISSSQSKNRTYGTFANPS